MPDRGAVHEDVSSETGPRRSGAGLETGQIALMVTGRRHNQCKKSCHYHGWDATGRRSSRRERVSTSVMGFKGIERKVCKPCCTGLRDHRR